MYSLKLNNQKERLKWTLIYTTNYIFTDNSVKKLCPVIHKMNGSVIWSLNSKSSPFFPLVRGHRSWKYSVWIKAIGFKIQTLKHSENAKCFMTYPNGHYKLCIVIIERLKYFKYSYGIYKRPENEKRNRSSIFDYIK